MKRLQVGKRYIVGIDEAGRGPIAGPLSLGFVAFKSEDYRSYKNGKDSLPKGRDSKKLSEARREYHFSYLEDMKKLGKVSFCSVFIGNQELDKWGLSRSIRDAIKKGLKKLNLPSEEILILLDGGLKAPLEFEQRTIIKGDEKERVIGLASIVAKVRRDRFMKRVSYLYPLYGFDQHKGYGTRNHYLNIKKHGLSPLHRRSFLKKFSSA